MDSPDLWRWIWMAATAAFLLGEMSTAGSFFLLPFAVGTAVAMIMAFAGATLTAQWVVFVGVSFCSFLAMRPLAKRFNAQGITEGIGARRLVGAKGTVLETIPGLEELGLVRVEREKWRAQSSSGAPITPGTEIYVLEVEGTRVLVSTTPPPPSTSV